MRTDWRALATELAAELERCRPLAEVPDCLARARASLTADGPAVPEGREPASVVGEPSDEEIMELMTQQMHDDLAAAVRAMAEQEGIDSTRAKGVMRIMLNRHVVDLARAVLARYGHQPAPPAAGEVGELARQLGVIAADAEAADFVSDATKLTRAAALLEQRHPVPMAVSERLPGPEDCDGEGRCWIHQPHEACPESPAWELMSAKYASANYGAVCWLPATALPLPAGEVK